MSAHLVVPFLTSTVRIFEVMLDVELAPGEPFVRRDLTPQHDITGIVGLSGATSGTVTVSFSFEMAAMAAEKLLGERPAEFDAHIADAVGELSNMIVGSAKAKLAHLDLSLGLPTVITGRQTMIAFPSRTTPISIPFNSKYGRLTIEVGIAG